MPRLQRRDRSDPFARSEEHTSELQSQSNLVCRLLLEKKKKQNIHGTFNLRRLKSIAQHSPPSTCAVPIVENFSETRPMLTILHLLANIQVPTTVLTVT